MELTSNQIVVFEDGTQHGWLEAAWSERDQAFYKFVDDPDARHGRRKILSTDVRDKQVKTRRKSKFVPSSENCTVRILPDGETEKAYIVPTGTNGYHGKGLRVYHEYIAKSICYIDEQGEIFAPAWASGALANMYAK